MLTKNLLKLWNDNNFIQTYFPIGAILFTALALRLVLFTGLVRNDDLDMAHLAIDVAEGRISIPLLLQQPLSEQTQRKNPSRFALMGALINAGRICYGYEVWMQEHLSNPNSIDPYLSLSTNDGCIFTMASKVVFDSDTNLIVKIGRAHV